MHLRTGERSAPTVTQLRRRKATDVEQLGLFGPEPERRAGIDGEEAA
jgi:hypothetical protein